MVPGILIQLHEFPHLPSGKINRRALLSPLKTSFTKDEIHIGPRTVVEEFLVSIWKDLLNVTKIDVRDNFFNLGGHSLLATRLLTRVRARYRCDLPLRILFDHPSLEEQALAIEEHLLEELEDEDLEEGVLNALLSSINSLSEEEAQALLDKETLNRDRDI